MNTNNMEMKICDLIRQTDDIKFLGIYKEFLSFRRKHFVEYHIIKKIPFIESMIETIEDEMDRRESIEDMAKSKLEEIFPEENYQEENEESWKKEWRKENEKQPCDSIKNDFKRILLYVVCFHVCVISFFLIQNTMSEDKEKEYRENRLKNIEEVMYPKAKGPLSDSLKQNKTK